MPSKKTASIKCHPQQLGCCIHCDTGLPKSLPGLVDHYMKSQDLPYCKKWNSMKSSLAGYRETTDFQAAVKMAIRAKDLVGNDHRQAGAFRIKRHSHQYRIEKVAIDSVLSKLKPSKLENVKSFDDLYARVYKICSDVHGIGPLYIYDAALRIGACLNLEPKQVYLHAGALTGAKALGIVVKRKIISVTAFPAPIQKLKPHEIEDFLCIYKDKLAAFRT